MLVSAAPISPPQKKKRAAPSAARRIAMRSALIVLGKILTLRELIGAATKRHKKHKEIFCDALCFFVAISFRPSRCFQYRRAAATFYRLRRREDVQDKCARGRIPPA